MSGPDKKTEMTGNSNIVPKSSSALFSRIMILYDYHMRKSKKYVEICNR